MTNQPTQQIEDGSQLELLRRYLSVSPYMYIVMDRKFHIIYLNKKSALIQGRPKRTLMGRDWFNEYIAASDRDQLRASFVQFIENSPKATFNFENYLLREDGRVKHIRWHLTVLRDKLRHITAIIAVGEDISDLKSTEEALIESKRRLDSIVRTIPDIVYRLDQHGKIVFISDSIKNYGYSPDTILGRKLIQWVHPEDQERVHYNIHERRTGQRRTQAVELRMLFDEDNASNGSDSGPERIFLLDAEGLYNAPQPMTDAFFGTQGIVRDITHFKDMQTEASRLASVVEQASESIVITDTKGNIEYVNPFFEQISGYRFDEVKGKNLNFLKSGEHDDEFYRQLWQTILEGKSWEGRFINKRKNDTYFYEDATIFPIQNKDGDVINYAAVKRDISAELKLKKQLQQAQKMEAVGQLAGGIAHDFNNILSVINGYSELALLQIDEHNPLHKKLKDINEAGLRAKELVNQLLAFSRRQIIEPKIINLNHLIPEVNKMILRLLDEDIKISFQFSDELWYIRADPGQIEQILINLIVNARDAVRGRSEKDILVRTRNVVLDPNFVEQHPGSHTGAHVELTVEDSGYGMDDKTQGKIFEPFFTTKQENEGTGLGLATVYGIVKQNNGSVYVTSQENVGTTFQVLWPAFEDGDETPVAPIDKASIPSGKETILLVEDNFSVREFTHEALQAMGYTVHVAENGRKALELVENQNIAVDLLITDVIMPEIGGRELAAQLSKTQKMRVLYTSGYTDQHIVSEGVLEEGVNFLQKPYNLNKLATKIREILTD